MHHFGFNNNYSFLNEEKKDQIVKDPRKEIKKRKTRNLMNNDNYNDIYMNNDVNNLNFKNDNYINEEEKYTFKCNDEFEKSDSSNRRIESDDEQEEHLQIINNAKNVLNLIQDDIYKFSKAYGMQKILRNNQSVFINNNSNLKQNSNYNNKNNNDIKYETASNNKNIYINNNDGNYEDNYYEDNKNNLNEDEEIDDEENEDEENEDEENEDEENEGEENDGEEIDEENYNEYNNNYGNDNNDDNEHNNYNEDDNNDPNEYNNYKRDDNDYENEENYEDEDNIYEIKDTNNDNDYDNNVNKSASIIKDYYKDYQNSKLNSLFHKNNYHIYNVNQDENIDYNYENYLDEEKQRKQEFLNDSTDNSNMIDNTNNSILTQNSSNSKYNFENPLNYYKEKMKNNIKNYSNYSNYINQKNKSYEDSINYNDFIYKKKIRKVKSSTKPQIRLMDNFINNNFVKSEYMDTISKTNNPKYKQLKKNRSLNISNDNLFSIKNKAKFENMKKELENKFAEAHPFRPKVNKKYNETKINEETEEERFNRLSRPKTLEIHKKKRKKDLEELKKISVNNKIKRVYKVNPEDVSNRLYNIYQLMKIKRDKIKQNYEENQNKNYSFTPEINSYSKILVGKHQKKPIYERNKEFQKQKKDNIIKMRKDIEKEQKERCKLLINEKSRKIASQNRYNHKKGYNEKYEDVYERLYKENINKDNTKTLGDKETKECTFAPKLNPMSSFLVNNNDNDFKNEDENCKENLKDFLERQKMYEKLKKEKLEKNKINNKMKYTFKPEINSNSDLLTKCNPDRIREKRSDKYSRLYEDAQRIQIKKEKLENELNNKYDFIPKINEVSQYLIRNPGFEEHKYAQENKVYSKMFKKEEEYDFKPQIYNNKKYKNIKSNYKNDHNMLKRINGELQNKNEKIKMMQKIKENKDIEQCNFTPEINKEIPDFENNRPLYMKGMARYLGQMEKARQAKRDKQQREKEVFLTGEGWNKNNGITVPKPFKLSYQNNKKMKMIKKGREKEEKKDSYNNSKTNESKNREIIKKLLNDN